MSKKTRKITQKTRKITQKTWKRLGLGGVHRKRETEAARARSPSRGRPHGTNPQVETETGNRSGYSAGAS